MWVPVVLGGLTGLGLWCVLRGVLAPRVPLETALEALGRPRPAASHGTGARVDDLTHRAGRWIMASSGSDLTGLRADLAVLERSEEVHLLQRMRTVAFYGLFPVLTWALLTFSGGVDLGHPVVVAAAAMVCGGSGWFVTDSQVRARARRRRNEFDTALVVYTSLVAILMAGGSGLQQALNDAVDRGRGWPFTVLRRALTDARVRGTSPWETFDEYADQLALGSLADLAATMELAGTSGAQVRESLLTKAAAMRNHEMAKVERAAASRTSAMVAPTGLMLVGFVVLIIYPAFDAVLNL